LARFHGGQCREHGLGGRSWHQGLGEGDHHRATTVGSRLYFAIVADSTPGNQHVAKTEFEEFLKLKPSVGQLAIARPFLKKLGIKIP